MSDVYKCDRLVTCFAKRLYNLWYSPQYETDSKMNKVALLSCSDLSPTVLCFGLSSSYLSLNCVIIRIKYFCTLPTVCVNVILIILGLNSDRTSTSSERYSCCSFGRFWIQISVRKPTIINAILYT